MAGGKPGRDCRSPVPWGLPLVWGKLHRPRRGGLAAALPFPAAVPAGPAGGKPCTNLVGKFISDIVLQVLSFVAQNERENIRQRQAEGIRIAKEKGVHMGRPKYKLPNNFTEIVVRYHNKELTHIEAAEILNMTRGTFLKYSKLIKKEQD